MCHMLRHFSRRYLLTIPFSNSYLLPALLLHNGTIREYREIQTLCPSCYKTIYSSFKFVFYLIIIKMYAIII